MALEEKIVEWSATRPGWQQTILSRVAAGEALSDTDYDDLLAKILSSTPATPRPLRLEHLATPTAQDAPVSLVSVANPEHVNALASDEPLTFSAKGLTIIYGDNGSGKSGYARLLKRVARARSQEQVLSDVFRETALAVPAARLTYRVGAAEATVAWPEGAPTELKRICFYDGACGAAYIADESDFPYRPAALFVMDGLINACVAIRTRLDTRLAENAARAATLPVVDPDLEPTPIGHFLKGLSGRSSPEMLEGLVRRYKESPESIEELNDQEARLRSADTRKERQALDRRSEKLATVRQHLERAHELLGSEALAALELRRSDLAALEQAADTFSKSFEAEPLRGVATAAWKALWEAAKRYSEQLVYPGHPFPVRNETGRCVLCQQSLDAAARDRFSRFDAFVKDDTQVRLREAHRLFEADVSGATRFDVKSSLIVGILTDLEPHHPELTRKVGDLLAQCAATEAAVAGAVKRKEAIPSSTTDPAPVLGLLETQRQELVAAVAALSDPAALQQRLTSLTLRRRELELLQRTLQECDAILGEISRLTEREALEAAKNAAATGPITNKILELSEESITEVVRDAFTRETERLKLERVTLSKTRAARGTLLHQPKLVGTRQQVTLPRVFSEGERTALGLSAFFTEAQLDASKSALILDDPVNSLDHRCRERVASRLVELAASRQVIIFTHDVALVADLKLEALGAEVSVTDRCVSRSRADERRPGGCSTEHPWKAKDVAERLGELRAELARIKRESKDWDERTYADAVASWAGKLSETWERILSQEIVGPVIVKGGLEVRPEMFRILVKISDVDGSEFSASYSRISRWVSRHDKSTAVNYVAPELADLEKELEGVDRWFKRVKAYKN